MKIKVSAALALLLVGVVACGDDTTDPTGSGGGSSSGGGGEGGDGGAATTSTSTGPGAGGATSSTTSTGTSTSSSSTGGGVECTQAAPADRDRFVVVGRPAVPAFEVLALSQAGELSATGHVFTMGEANDQPIVFTPDGRIGVAVQEGGSLGVFTLAEDGTPKVVDAAFQPGGSSEFYAAAVIMSPDGDHLIAVNQNWPESGGGLYRVDLNCDTGELTLAGKQIESKNAWGVLSLGGGRWAVAGKGAGGVEDATDVHDVREGDPWTRVAGVDAFGYDDAIPGGFGASRDGSFMLVGDISEFSGVPTNLRFVGVDAGGFTVSGSPVDFEDPFAIVVGPSRDVALVASGYGDALFIVDVDPDAAQPISVRGELAYVKNPQLPGKMVMIERGSLDGLVLGSDVDGLRMVRFVGDEVVDHGVFTVAEGIDGIVAGVGVQP